MDDSHLVVSANSKTDYFEPMTRRRLQAMGFTHQKNGFVLDMKEDPGSALTAIERRFDFLDGHYCVKILDNVNEVIARSHELIPSFTISGDHLEENCGAAYSIRERR